MSNALLYAVTVAIWGSTWLAIEFQLGVVPPEVSVFYRYAAAAVILFGWCRLRSHRLRFGLHAHAHFALLGVLLFGLNYIVAYHAQQYITSALMAIAFSTMLWMNIVNARLFFGVRIDRRVVVGALLGVAGIGLMFSPSIGALSLNDATVYGAALSVVGAYVASLGNMASQAAQRRQLPVVESNAWGMAYGASFTGLVALVQGQPFVFDWSIGYVGSLLYLTVFGSILAFGAYLTLLGRIGAHKAGYAVVLFPVVALVLSALFEGLQLDPPLLGGVALVLLGNYLVMRRRPPLPASPHPSPIRGEVAQGFVRTRDFRIVGIPGCIAAMRKFRVRTKNKRDPVQSVTDAG